MKNFKLKFISIIAAFGFAFTSVLLAPLWQSQLGYTADLDTIPLSDNFSCASWIYYDLCLSISKRSIPVATETLRL